MKQGSCSLCGHPKRAEIDAASVSGVTVREIAKQHGVSKNTVQKHVAQHIPAAVQKAAAEERERDAGDSILAEVERLIENAKRLQGLAEKKKDYRTAVAAAREWREIVELQARLLGELKDREISITNVQLDPDTATRMAEMFLSRRKPLAIAAAVDSESISSTEVSAKCP